MSVEDLKRRLQEAEAEAEHFRSLVEAFFTGDPMGRGVDHIIMAQWGRRRLAEKQANKTAVLLARPPEA